MIKKKCVSVISTAMSVVMLSSQAFAAYYLQPNSKPDDKTVIVGSYQFKNLPDRYNWFLNAARNTVDTNNEIMIAQYLKTQDKWMKLSEDGNGFEDYEFENPILITHIEKDDNKFPEGKRIADWSTVASNLNIQITYKDGTFKKEDGSWILDIGSDTSYYINETKFSDTLNKLIAAQPGNIIKISNGNVAVLEATEEYVTISFKMDSSQGVSGITVNQTDGTILSINQTTNNVSVKKGSTITANTDDTSRWQFLGWLKNDVYTSNSENNLTVEDLFTYEPVFLDINTLPTGVTPQQAAESIESTQKAVTSIKNSLTQKMVPAEDGGKALPVNLSPDTESKLSSLASSDRVKAKEQARDLARAGVAAQVEDLKKDLPPEAAIEIIEEDEETASYFLARGFNFDFSFSFKIRVTIFGARFEIATKVELKVPTGQEKVNSFGDISINDITDATVGEEKALELVGFPTDVDYKLTPCTSNITLQKKEDGKYYITPVQECNNEDVKIAVSADKYEAKTIVFELTAKAPAPAAKEFGDISIDAITAKVGVATKLTVKNLPTGVTPTLTTTDTDVTIANGSLTANNAIDKEVTIKVSAEGYKDKEIKVHVIATVQEETTQATVSSVVYNAYMGSDGVKVTINITPTTVASSDISVEGGTVSGSNGAYTVTGLGIGTYNITSNNSKLTLTGKTSFTIGKDSNAEQDIGTSSAR